MCGISKRRRRWGQPCSAASARPTSDSTPWGFSSSPVDRSVPTCGGRTMSDPFLTLGQVLAGRIPCPEADGDGVLDGPYRRLFKALRCLVGGCGSAPGTGDLAVLTRQVLRFEP